VFLHAIEWYIRPKACKHCGYKRFYLDKERTRKRVTCVCEGYHYPHRPGSMFCVTHPDYQVNVRTLRYGEKLEDVLEDIRQKELCSL
jgi:hypothetical protein